MVFHCKHAPCVKKTLPHRVIKYLGVERNIIFSIRSKVNYFYTFKNKKATLFTFSCIFYLNSVKVILKGRFIMASWLMVIVLVLGYAIITLIRIVGKSLDCNINTENRCAELQQRLLEIKDPKSVRYFIVVHEWWLSSVGWDTIDLPEETVSDKDAHEEAFNLLKNRACEYKGFLHQDYLLFKCFDNKILRLEQPDDITKKISRRNDSSWK